MGTEKEMRGAVVPSVGSVDELSAYISNLVGNEDQHDYGTAVYAMSMAATAAFNYAAKTLGVTGFQASCADMDFLRRTRGMEGPFMIVKGEDALFPQYDIPGKVTEFLSDIQPWLAEQAAKKLESGCGAHPNVMAHWQKLAAQVTP